jgi:hypothetical protein
MATLQEVVNTAYLLALGRPADPDGLKHYVAQLESGKRVDGRRIGIGDILADLEYAARPVEAGGGGLEDKAANQAITARGGWDFAPPPAVDVAPPPAVDVAPPPPPPPPAPAATEPLTAQGLYNQFLGGRPALEKDLQFWNNYITQYGPEQAMAAFDAAADQERDMDLAARAASLRDQELARDGTVMKDGEKTVREGALTAQVLYNEYLGGRSALPADIDYWNNYIAVYGPDKARAAFQESAQPEKSAPIEERVASLRDQNLTVPGSLLGEFATQRKATPAEVRSMYLSVLGREPDPEGFSYYTSQPIENLRQSFYQASLPETEKRVAEIPVTTTIPTPVIGQRSEPTAQELYLGLGRAPDPAGLAFYENYSGPNREATFAAGAAEKGEQYDPTKPMTIGLPGQTTTTSLSGMTPQQRDLSRLMVSKMPQPVSETTTAPSVFSPENVAAQLELERLRLQPTPEPPAETPVAGFAQGGLVNDDINRMLRNQRKCNQRESQSRRMLTNLGAPPVKKFSDGGPAGSSSSGVRRLKMSGYQAGGDVSPAMMTPEQLDEFNRNLQRELDEENRRFEKSGGPEFYSAIRPAMEDINERVKQTLELYRMGRATEADVQKLLPSLSEYEIASQFGRTDTGGYRSRGIDAPSRDRLREFIETQKPTIDANRPDMFPYEKYDPRGPRAQGRVLEMSKGGDVTDEMFLGTAPSEESQQTTGEYIKGLYKENIPVHARVYLETLLGKKDPITAEDFTKDELARIDSLIQKTEAERLGKTLKNQADLQSSLERTIKRLSSQKDIAKKMVEDPDWIAYGELDKKPTSPEVANERFDAWTRFYNKFADQAFVHEDITLIMGDRDPKKVQSYLDEKKQKNKQTTEYLKDRLSKVNQALDAVQGKGLKGAVDDYSAYGSTSPEEMEDTDISRTLGRFNYETLPNGRRVVKDTYDFYNEYRAPMVEEYEKMGPAKKALSVLLEAVKDPVQLPSVLGNAYIGRDGRPVKVEYDPKDLPVKRQEGSPPEGEVNENPYVRMAREERAAQDKAFDSVNRQLSDLLERYKEGNEGITEKDLLPFFPGYNEYDIAQMYGTTTESSVPSMSSKARSFTPEIMSNLRKYDELMQKDFDRLVKEKRLPRDVITARTLGLANGGEVTNDEFIQEMFTGTRPEDFPETSPVDKKAGELLRALSEGTRGFVGAEPIEAGSEAYRTGQALANMPAVGVVAATAKGAGKAKDALKALTKKDIKLIASELETSRGQLAELAKKYPQLRDASVADIEALTKGEPFTAFRGISLLPGRELRKESTPSMTVDPSVALGMLKDAPVMITKEGFITATPVLRQYPGMKASETQVYVPSLIEQITERQPGALEMKIPTRSGEKMTVADVFKEVKGEKELLADVSKKEPRDILFDRYQGGVGDRYLMEVARRVLAGKWDGGEALLKEIGGYQTDPKGLVQEFDSFAELVKESALKKANGGEVTNDEFIQEMMTGTRPSDFPETSPVDTAVSDYLKFQSKAVTDPKAYMQALGENIKKYHTDPLQQDPQKYLMEQLGPGQGLMGAIKPRGGIMPTTPGTPWGEYIDEVVGAAQKSYANIASDRREGVVDFIKKKLDKYIRSDFGTEEDPLRRAIESGRLETFGKDKDTFRSYALKAAREGDPDAVFDVTKAYDIGTGIRPTVMLPTRDFGEGQLAKQKAVDDLVSKIVAEGGDPETARSIVERQLRSVSRDETDKALQTGEEGYSKVLKTFGVDKNRPKDMGFFERALDQGDIAYGKDFLNLQFLRPQDLAEALGAIPSNKLASMDFPEAVVEGNRLMKKSRDLDENIKIAEKGKGSTLPKEILFFGTKPLKTPAKSGQWINITDPDAARLEGALMRHSVHGYGKEGPYGLGGKQALLSGKANLFSLRDEKGLPMVTVEMENMAMQKMSDREALKTPDFKVRQVQGKFNSAPEDYIDDVFDLAETINGRWSEGPAGNQRYGKDRSGKDLDEPKIIEWGKLFANRKAQGKAAGGEITKFIKDNR